MRTLLGPKPKKGRRPKGRTRSERFLALAKNTESTAYYAATSIKFKDHGIATAFHRNNRVAMVGPDTIQGMEERGYQLRLAAENVLKIRIGLLKLQLNNRSSRDDEQHSCMRTRGLALMIKDDYFKCDLRAGRYFFSGRHNRTRLYREYIAKFSKRAEALKLPARLSRDLRLLDLTRVT